MASMRVSLALLAALPLQASAVRLKTHGVLHDKAEGDPCRCLNWKELYASGKVVCGEFAEFSKYEKRTDRTLDEISELWTRRPDKMESVCNEYMEKLNASICVPYWDKLREEGAWCYVSDQCQDLGSGHVISDKVVDGGVTLKRELAARTCHVDETRLDRDLTPEELYRFAKKNVINMADLVMNVYDLEWGQSWLFFEGAWNKDNFTQVKKKVIKDQPQVVTKGWNSRNEMMIIWKNKLWELYRAPKRCKETQYCLERRTQEITIPEGTKFTPRGPWYY